MITYFTESRKHYDAYEYHGDTYNKYDVNRDGVDDRLDLDRNGKIDKFERKNKYGYGSFGTPDHRYDRHGTKHDKYHKYEKHDHYDKHDYHRRDKTYEKDHYATSQSYKKHAPYKADAYDKKHI